MRRKVTNLITLAFFVAGAIFLSRGYTLGWIFVILGIYKLLSD